MVGRVPRFAKDGEERETNDRPGGAGTVAGKHRTMEKTPKRVGLNLKLVILFLLVALLPLGLISTITHQETKTITEETVSRTANLSINEEIGTISAGVWISPYGSGNLSQKTFPTSLSYLRDPARTLRITVDGGDDLDLGYIGTSDGVLVLWPDITETLRKIAPFDYRERPWYLLALDAGQTVWTKPYRDTSTGALAVTCATPIYVGDETMGVAGMDVSLVSMHRDLSSYPLGYIFLIDGEGTVIMRPDTPPERFPWDELLAERSLLEMENSNLAAAIQKMVQGEAGLSVVRLNKGDCHIAYAPLTSTGWSLGMVQSSGDRVAAAAKAIQYDEFFRRIEDQNEVVAESVVESLLVSEYGGEAVGAREPAAGAGASDQRTMILVIFLIAGALAGVVGLQVGYSITRPVASITEALQRVGKGDLDVKVDVRSSDEIGDLSEAFQGMERDLKRHLDRVKSDSFELGRTRVAEDIAREIRESLLPGKVPQADGYEIVASSLPIGRSRGHFYNVFETGEDRTGLVMADVSGEGLPAAIFMVHSKTLIEMACMRYPDPARALEMANVHIGKNANSGMMVTCFCGVVDATSQFVEYANTGHIPPFVVDSQGRVETLGGGGIALGTLEKIKLEPDRTRMETGDVLVIYTDGVIDAENEEMERFGTERLISLVKDTRASSASGILKAVEEAVRAHTGDKAQNDDLTLMIVKRYE